MNIGILAPNAAIPSCPLARLAATSNSDDVRPPDARDGDVFRGLPPVWSVSGTEPTPAVTRSR